MQDQHFIHGWNKDAGDFAADFQQALNRLSRQRQGPGKNAASIGSPYDAILDRRCVDQVRPGLSPAARASLRGLAASVITFALWVGVMLVATPAPGLAGTVTAPTTLAAECIAHPALA